MSTMCLHVVCMITSQNQAASDEIIYKKQPILNERKWQIYLKKKVTGTQYVVCG